MHCSSTHTSPGDASSSAAPDMATTYARSTKSSRLEGLADAEVLALAPAESRILVTHNIADFPTILRDWAEASRPHAGVILIYAIDHNEFDLIERGIQRLLESRPSPSA